MSRVTNVRDRSDLNPRGLKYSNDIIMTISLSLQFLSLMFGDGYMQAGCSFGELGFP